MPQNSPAILTVLIEELSAATDYEKRNTMWRKIAKNMQENYSSIPIILVPQIRGYNSKKVGEWPENMGTKP
ncbi:hypothetical protein ACFLZG_06080 [Thermodesulfobacteriota bacterium]